MVRLPEEKKNMSKAQELHIQIHKITELNNVLLNLLADRFLCDMEITEELFCRYVDLVDHHLKNTETEIFSKLLTKADDDQARHVDRFIGGAKEIKQIFNSYTKKWIRNKHLKIKHYETFFQETEEMFDLVLNRLQDETEKLYPLMKALEIDH